MSVNEQSPHYVVPQETLIPVCDYPQRMAPIPPSRMFVIVESLKKFKDKQPDTEVFHASQGDGGKSLPGVPRYILDEAHRLQCEKGTSYDMPFGTPAFREAVVNDYWKLDSATGIGPNNVIAGVGGRDILNKAYEAMMTLGAGRFGDVIVFNRVPWISYSWGPYGMGANVMLAPGEQSEGWQMTPEGLAECVKVARASGREVAGVIITNPDNPTGRTMTAERQIELGKAALAAGIHYVLYDWIYHWVTEEQPMDLNSFLPQFSADERKRIMFLDGVTKSLGGSNIRNAHLIADEAFIKFMQTRASHGVIPSFHSMAVAMAAYTSGFEKAAATINEPTNKSRAAVRKFVAEQNIETILGQGYYAFMNLKPYLDKDRDRFPTTEELGAYFAEEWGLAVVPGPFFSQFAGDWIRFSYATPEDRTVGALNRMMEALGAL